MPQLSIWSLQNQLFWSILVFGIFYFFIISFVIERTFQSIFVRRIYSTEVQLELVGYSMFALYGALVAFNQVSELSNTLTKHIVSLNSQKTFYDSAFSDFAQNEFSDNEFVKYYN